MLRSFKCKFANLLIKLLTRVVTRTTKLYNSIIKSCEQCKIKILNKNATSYKRQLGVITASTFFDSTLQSVNIMAVTSVTFLRKLNCR